MVKVLVFPAGTEIAFEIHNSLKNCKFIELYGATSVPCHAEMVFKRLVGGIPFVKDAGFVQALNDVIDMWGIDYVYPAHDDALLELTRYQDEIHADVVTSSVFTVFTCRSKYSTYKHLLEDGAWFLPWFCMLNEGHDIRLPAFAKPNIGQGANGVVKLETVDDLERLERTAKEKYVVCEYLGGEEITVDCFTDKHGTLLFINERSRDRIRSGIAVRSETLAAEPEVVDIALFLNKEFAFNGAWFFQMKKDKHGEYKLLEVAPRIAGTMGLSRNIGANMPLLTMYNMLGKDVEIITNDNDALVDRAFISRYTHDMDYKNVFVDFDDTLIVNGEVNVMLMAFLYQAKRDGKKIVLMSRHRGDIFSALEKHNICLSLFDSVIFVMPNQHKSAYVRKDSIFIDDSFSERKDVKDTCGVPVFDVDMVESLIDWRA